MTGDSNDPRLVVVHERFTEHGGSEQVARRLAGLSANSRVFAPIVDWNRLPVDLPRHRLSSSFLQPLYRSHRSYAHLLPLLPFAMASTDLSDADVVITSHHAFANRVNVRPDVPLISYTHSPARWMWDHHKLDGEPGGRAGTLALRAFSAALRPSDREAARRADLLVANSRTVAQRIRRWWGRDSIVVHPPVDVDFFALDEEVPDREPFFLVAGRLVPYKRIDIAVRAATRLNLQLVVAGGGRSLTGLKALAGPSVHFLGPVSDETLRGLYQRCSALLFPGDEDFGIVPVEAQACGTPVIARASGGATETVVDGVTGHLVQASTSDFDRAFRQAMADHGPGLYDRTAIRANAERFSASRFVAEFDQILATTVSGWKRSTPTATSNGAV